MASPARTRLEQVRPPTPEVDTRTAEEIKESSSVEDAQALFELLLSQVKRIIHGNSPGNWNDDIESIFGQDASLRSILEGSGYIVPDHVRSNVGEFTVPSSSVEGALVCVTGAGIASHADNGSETTAPAFAVIKDKPTSTTATLLFVGRAGGYSGLTPGKGVFLGSDGGMVQEGALPTATGSVIQRVGVAISSSTIIFAPMDPIIL